ncbi:MAG: ATP-binding protein [Firmicutes bacterium]|nr:ATP-binding protein [Bacillota bacterium]
MLEEYESISLSKPSVYRNSCVKWVFPLCKALHNGKTHLAIAIAFSVCRKGKRVRFTTAANLVNELLAAEEHHELLRLQRVWKKYDLVVIDELGYVPFM